MKKKFSIAFMFGFLTISIFAHTEGKQEINILFLGKSGVGKSSLINIFYNHVKGAQYTDPRDIVIPLLHFRDNPLNVNVDEFKAYNVKLSSGGRSQTDQVHKYTIENEKAKVTFWDAPGVLDTEGAGKDEENVKKIIASLGVVTINAVAVVLEPNDQARNSLELEAAINRMRLMLPKSYSEVMIGVFNRINGLGRMERKALTSWFSDRFELGKSTSGAKVYFIDGSSFFDNIKDADEEDLAMGKAKWQRDFIEVSKIIEDVSKNAPVSGTDILTLQKAVDEIEEKMKSLPQKLLALQSLTTDLKLLGLALEKENSRRDANKDFQKKRDVEFEVIEREYSGWWIFTGSSDVKRMRKQTIEFVDEGQRSEHDKAIEAIKKSEDRLAESKLQIEKLTAEQIEVVRQIKQAQANREKLAMTTNLDPYIKYLEEKIRAVRDSKTLCEEERNIQVEMYKEWIASYNDMRRITQL